MNVYEVYVRDFFEKEIVINAESKDEWNIRKSKADVSWWEKVVNKLYIIFNFMNKKSNYTK